MRLGLQYKIKHSPGAGSNRLSLVGIANHDADNSTNENNDENDQGDDDGGPVLAPKGGLLAHVHDRGRTVVTNVVRLHDSARGRGRVVAFQLGEVRDGLRLRHHRELGQRVRYRLGVLRLAKVTALGRRRRGAAAVGLARTTAALVLLGLVRAEIAVGGVACLVRHLRWWVVIVDRLADEARG